MAVVAKINKEPIGEFIIKFSLKQERFEIIYPNNKELHEKAFIRNFDLKSWQNVLEELESIKEQYLFMIAHCRTVIIVQLQTSESTYDRSVRDIMGIGRHTEKEDLINGAEGFLLKWYVAEEFLYSATTKKYKVVDSNSNDNKSHSTNILPQMFSSYHGTPRVFDYSKSLHQFLKNMDIQIKDMLQKMIAYMNIDNKTFLENIKQSTLLLNGKS